jgi:imidazolonepropionase
MDLVIENASQVVTCNSPVKLFKSGKKQSDIGLLTNSSIYCENGRIKWIGKKMPDLIRKKNLNKIDAKGKTILPGFIDCHTHTVFAGDRAEEFSMRIRGKTYEEIASAGGGILKTVNAVRKATEIKLKQLALERLKRSIEFGVTSIEIKSGYGLDTKNEIKMLEVINELKKDIQIDIYPSFLGAHAVPKGKSKTEYIDEIIYEMIPFIAKKKLAMFIDVFCEKNYFSPKETDAILKQGIKFGLIPKLHTNQFYSIGGIKTAIKNKAVSVEHLEVMKDSDIKLLADKKIIAVLLPAVSYFLDIPYAPARKLIKNNVPVALATDFNPGSSMTQNIQLVMSFAVHKLKMNIEETINAVTINAAAALGISDTVGSIENGKWADLLIFDVPDYKQILYNFGMNFVESVIKKGEVIKK